MNIPTQEICLNTESIKGEFIMVVSRDSTTCIELWDNGASELIEEIILSKKNAAKLADALWAMQD